MTPFRDLPIQRKITVMTLVIVGTILPLAILVLFTFQVLNFRASFQSENATLAAATATNSTVALAFKDADNGAEVIGSLSAAPQVISATLMEPDGSVLARFGADENAASLSRFPPAGKARFTGGDLLLTQPVFLEGKRTGTLYLRSNFQRLLFKMIKLYGLLVLAIAISAISLAIFLSGRFQRFVAGPVLHLAATAQIIGRENNYSVRAMVTSRGDELGQLTQCFNEMLDRIQTQDAAITLSQKQTQALIDSVDGVVWECDPVHFQFSFVSQHGERLLGFAPEVWLAEAGFWQAHLFPDDATKAVQLRQAHVRAGKSYRCEYRMVTAKARVIWIRESGSVLVEQGKTLALRGIFLDITVEKTAAEELEKLNRRLLDTSRLAGMAEVATGVLHNVGNVLNSLNVSATLVNGRLKQTSATNLCRAIALLGRPDGRLAEFLTHDPKGQVLPDYLAAAAEVLQREQAELVEEVNSMRKNIEHIKEIVALQQSFAKVSRYYERLSAEGLVEDALRINAAAFERHGVRILREFAPSTPPLSADQHKVIQILINLFSNAMEAMEAPGALAKELVIRIGPGRADRVQIAVADRGIGIAPEDRVKIFSHGFTTKKDGHGFGLHSCANSAKEMGGSLVCQSAGIGQGATFILELPAALENRPEKSTATGGIL
jgi:signal transduction histidine kinase